MSLEYEAYVNYLETDHWKHLRLLKFKQVGRKCQCCESKERLHVHHIRYKNYFNCDVDDLAVLCEVCHDTLHLILKQAKRDSSEFEVHQIKDLVVSYQETPEGELRSQRIIENKANRAQMKRVYKLRKKTFHQIIQRVGTDRYTKDAIEQCIHALISFAESSIMYPKISKKKTVKNR